jgi:hypothetical protein
MSFCQTFVAINHAVMVVLPNFGHKPNGAFSHKVWRATSMATIKFWLGNLCPKIKQALRDACFSTL